MARARVADGGKVSNYGVLLRIYWLSCRGKTKRGYPSTWGVGMGLTTLHLKNTFVTNILKRYRTWSDHLDKRSKRRDMYTRFGLWNVRSLYRAASLKTVSRELARYKLHSVGVQEVRWEGGSTQPAGEYTFFYWKKIESHALGTGFFRHKRIIPAVKKVEFVSDMMSYIILRGCWCRIIVLNVHAPTENKTDDVKDSF
jgi:hypothetical protein